MLCTNLFLGLPLLAELPEADIRYVDQGTTTDAQRLILGDEAILHQMPAGWTGKPVWLVLSGWGQSPQSEEEVHRRVRAALETLGHTPNSGRIIAVMGGFKWAVFVEVR